LATWKYGVPCSFWFIDPWTKEEMAASSAVLTILQKEL